MSSAVNGKPPAVCTKVFTLAKVVFLFVPPAPSSTIIKSEVVSAAPMSVPPSISKALNATFPAVERVANLESTIAAEELISALTIESDVIAARPATLKVTSPVTASSISPVAAFLSEVLVASRNKKSSLVKSNAVISL